MGKGGVMEKEKDRICGGGEKESAGRVSEGNLIPLLKAYDGKPAIVTVVFTGEAQDGRKA